MRPIERIDNFLDKVNWFDLLKNRWKLDIPEDSWKIFAYTLHIKSNWKENPDQRIGQLLINLGIIPDNLTAWYDEEENILIDQGIPPEECVYWTSIYDKENKLLDKPITRLIKDLSINHIQNIKRYAWNKQLYLPTNVTQAFNNMINKDIKKAT